jgi:hypothetical protein
MRVLPTTINVPIARAPAHRSFSPVTYSPALRSTATATATAPTQLRPRQLPADLPVRLWSMMGSIGMGRVAAPREAVRGSLEAAREGRSASRWLGRARVAAGAGSATQTTKPQPRPRHENENEKRKTKKGFEDVFCFWAFSIPPCRLRQNPVGQSQLVGNSACSFLSHLTQPQPHPVLP